MIMMGIQTFDLSELDQQVIGGQTDLNNELSS